MFTALKRIFSTTGKQIKRSGWLAWASVMVMALAFFIASIFTMLAYLSNLFLQSIENEPHIYVFFNSGTEAAEIDRLKNEWSTVAEIQQIEFTDEESALAEFSQAQERVNPEVAENVKGVRTNIFPASLGIRLHRIQDADKVIQIAKSEQESNPNIFAVVFSKETIDTIKSLFYWLRLGGGIIMALLLVVIFAFTLLTVEFRTFSRSEEIGIMQLVGGSLWFIRSPFIFEGAFYGFVGALISTTIIYALGYLVFIVNRDSNAVSFLINFFGDLQWPNVNIVHFLGLFTIMLLLGTFIGGFNSYVAIKRYIN